MTAPPEGSREQKMSIGRKVRTSVLAGLFLASSATVAFAATVKIDGGVWEYGTNWYSGWAYSKYNHPSKAHRSSLGNGTKITRSDCMPADQLAEAWYWRSPGTGIAYYYDFC